MIAFLKGILEARQENGCLVDVNGVGYEVFMPAAEVDRLPTAGQPVQLFIWQVMREDGTFLYGFMTVENRLLFKLLLGVTGVGPKAALAVLSALSREQLEQVVIHQDAAALSRLPGIGRKTAERLLLELKDKLKTTGMPAAAAVPGGWSEFSEALEGLIALGYSAPQARRALQLSLEEQSAPDKLAKDHAASLIRLALKHL